jgi:ketosteroid isomerase-like protein
MIDAVTIRHATEADRGRLLRLAELDGGAAPRGDVVLAEVDGELRAAVGETDGRSVGDPFHHTADLIRLLRTHADLERAA